MSKNNSMFADSILQLQDTRSHKRRSAAKRLRKIAQSAACPELLAALQREVQDRRTWETQYQMVMALGTCGCTEALDFLWQLARSDFDATMVYVALGDAIVRLGRAFENDPAPMLAVLATDNEMLIDGALRATAMLRLRFETTSIDAILKYLQPRGLADGLRFWAAAAAPGWESPRLEEFLDTCICGLREDIREAALAAKARRYRKYSPL